MGDLDRLWWNPGDSGAEDTTVRVGDEYLILEPFDRELECEHRDVLGDGSLDPCHNEAAWTTRTPMWSDETRTRRCAEHIMTELQRWVESREADDGKR